MKIIQTFWTKPGIKAGWNVEVHNLMSWSLSCLTLRKFYDEVELYTDSYGKFLLIDVLNLPYTKYHVVLDDFKYPPMLWAMAKVYVYSLQNEGFIHVDGDIFISGKVFDPFLNNSAELVFQNLEIESNVQGFYSKIIGDLLSSIEGELPEWLKKVVPLNIEAMNAGIFGGTNISFFKQHSNIVFNFLDCHLYLLKKMKSPSILNHFLEQVCSRILAADLNIKYQCLLPAQYFNKEKNNSIDLITLDHFGISSRGKEYIHLLGSIKQNLHICEMMENRLNIEFPTFYKKILDFFYKKVDLPLNLDEFLKKSITSTSLIKPTPKEVFSKKHSSIREKINRMSMEKLFFRTHDLYRYFLNKSLPKFNNIDDFAIFMNDKLETLSDSNLSDRIKDIYQYEFEKYLFGISIKSDYLYTNKRSKYLCNNSQFYSQYQDDIDDFLIGINATVKLVYTKWDWTIQVQEMMLIELQQPAKQYQVSFSANLFANRIHELNISKVAQFVIYRFKTPDSYKQGLENILQDLKLPSTEDYKQNIFNTIIFLINSNVLCTFKNNQVNRTNKIKINY